MKTQEPGPCPLELKYKTQTLYQRPQETMAQVTAASLPAPQLVTITWMDDEQPQTVRLWGHARNVLDPLTPASRVDIEVVQAHLPGLPQGAATSRQLQRFRRKRQREQEEEKEEKTRKKMKEILRKIMDEEIDRAVELLQTAVQDLASSTIPPSREEEPDEEDDNYAPQEQASREEDEEERRWVRGGPGSPYYRRTGNFGDDTANEQ